MEKEQEPVVHDRNIIGRIGAVIVLALVVIGVGRLSGICSSGVCPFMGASHYCPFLSHGAETAAPASPAETAAPAAEAPAAPAAPAEKAAPAPKP